MNLKRRASLLSKIVLMLLAQQSLTGATITKASRGARHLSLGLRLTDPTELDKALKLAEAIALASNSKNVLSTRQAGLILYQFQLAQGFWESYTRADLPTPEAVGLAEQRRPVAFELDPPHALIAGTTGSGKSETVKSILLSLLTSHTPDTLSLVLLDPNRDYSDLANAAHLAIPIAHDADSIRTALAYANRELLHRIERDNKAGKLLIVAIDEAEGETALGDKINLGFAQNIAKRGRAFGLHLIVSTQEPKEKNLEGFLGQLLNRFVGTVRDARESALFTGHAGLNAHKLTGKGDFLHVVGATHDRFQVAMVTHRDVETLPRAEAKPPFEDVSRDLVVLPDEPEPNTGGRPPIQIDPVTTARYFWHNPYAVSRTMARERFGLTRTAHDLHKDFTIQFTEELKRLRGERSR